MEISKKHIIFYTFIAMLFFSSIPYLFYGVKTMSTSNSVIGSLANNSVSVGKIGYYFVYIKDVLASLLIVFLIPKIRKNVFIYTTVIVIYGLILLILTGRFEIAYVMAGYRTYLFAFVTLLLWQKYEIEKTFLVILTNTVKFGILIQFIVTMGQVFANGNFSSFGGGAYRYSGAFAGSGNLGFFCIAATLFLFVVHRKYKLMNTNDLILNLVLMLFLTVASGTRTAIFVVAFFAIYMIMISFEKSFHLNKKFVLIIFGIVILIFGDNIFTWILNRIGRGELITSGSGRIGVLQNLIYGGSIIEALFGRGIGYATNASINLGAKDSKVSDATLNLIIAQFGIIGVILFISFAIFVFYTLFKRSKGYLDCLLMSVIIFIILFFVGNMFEQIAMVIIYITTLFLLFDNQDRQKN